MIEDWPDIHQRIVDQATDQWRVRLNACVDAKGKHFKLLRVGFWDLWLFK